MLAHNVFFSLTDNSPAARQELVDDCHKLLAPIPGSLFYAAGELADDLNRDVNDREFDVALHVVFADKAAHDAYSVHDLHQKFVQKHKDNWKNIRVFDSYVASVE
jgi:hypothetical protein